MASAWNRIASCVCFRAAAGTIGFGASTVAAIGNLRTITHLSGE